MKKETETAAPAKNPLGKAMIPIGFVLLVVVLLGIGWAVRENPELAPDEEVATE